ncbi:hypothetical protein [Ruminococcus sp.]|uniref:hypothetical protein n=1 Tax=Ruminococcus sp. TaxID=41978 RepID=UPI0039A0CC02
MADAVKTKFDETTTLVDMCNKYRADVGKTVIFLELMGGLTEEETKDVLYVAIRCCCRNESPPMMPA